MKKKLITGLTALAIFASDTLCYNLGKNHNQPRGITNLNINPEGPRSLYVETNNLNNKKVFIEIDDPKFGKIGSYITSEEYDKIFIEGIKNWTLKEGVDYHTIKR